MKKMLAGLFVYLVTTGLLFGVGTRYLATVGEDGKTLIKDKETGLTWQGEYQENLSWRAAMAYCHELVYGGYADWKLPDRRELYSLVDYVRHSPASIFPPMPADWFWSCSSYAGSDDIAWSVYLGGGREGVGHKDSDLTARCVRQ